MRVIGIDNYDWPAKFRSASNLALASETESINHGNMGPAQFRWLKDTLAGAGDKNTIAFTHLPLDEMLGGTTSPGGTKIPGVPKSEIISLLIDNNVNHVFIGHWHRNETKDLGGVLQVNGAPVFQDYLFNELENVYGGKWDMYTNPMDHAHAMIAHIDKKRKELGIDKARERVLMDMADRQALDA